MRRWSPTCSRDWAPSRSPSRTMCRGGRSMLPKPRERMCWPLQSGGNPSARSHLPRASRSVPPAAHAQGAGSLRCDRARSTTRAARKIRCASWRPQRLRASSMSCNPPSFARDAKMLIEGGYRLERLKPVGQFRWSTHVELVGSLRRSLNTMPAGLFGHGLQQRQ